MNTMLVSTLPQNMSQLGVVIPKYMKAPTQDKLPGLTPSLKDTLQTCINMSEAEC